MIQRSIRHHRTLLIPVCAVWLVLVSGCERAVTSEVATGSPSVAAETPEPVEEAPLLLDDEPLLLLDDPADDASNGAGADNSRCFVCHVNYAQEKIAVTHARMNIGCATCHGVSDEHIADESWASGGNGTAPDIMYPKDEIIPSCMKCHSKEKLDGPQHEPVFAPEAKRKVCTDCHGDHRLPQRRCQWK
ncbi:MAG: cytochrome c3 family protein [Sedimentisphaerales bacterium]|nr:cytochrome c3 family protein [Sedimentisphaerales bacterium]